MKRIATLLAVASLCTACVGGAFHSAADAPDRYRLAGHLEALRRQLGLPERLGDLGVTEDDISALAESAALEWTARYNPRPVAVNDLEALYRAAL